MVKDTTAKDYLFYIKFIFEKIHFGIKEVHVSNDIFKSLSKYIQRTTRDDSKMVSDDTLILRGATVKNKLHGNGQIKFIEKHPKSF